MLTLKKVKELVEAPSHAKRTPSPKMLFEEGIVLLRREFDQGSHLTVYNSGYVLFSAGKRNTVFHIHGCCGDYAYDAAEGKGDVIEEEYFESCEWHIRALFEGERKMEDNQAKCEDAGRSNVCVSYHALSEDWSEIADRTINMLEKIIENSDSLVTTTQIAKEYGCGAKVFNRLLHLHGIQYLANGQWVLYSEHHGKGYTSSLTFRLQRSDGSEVEKLHTAWTQKGRQFLYHTLKRRGVLPLAEQGDTELFELKAELPDKWEYYIDRLSGYIASTGRKYKNHAATIRRWAADDTAKAAPKRGIPDYSYKEGESL